MSKATSRMTQAEHVKHDTPDQGASITSEVPPTTTTDLGFLEESLEDPRLYFNRELSLLQFQRRVFEEAVDSRNPLLERVKFIAILQSNIDEFFMVRVAGLMQQAAAGKQEPGIDGRTPTEALDLISKEVRSLSGEVEAFVRKDLLPALSHHCLRILEFAVLNQEQRAAMEAYFLENVFPVITPLAFDPGRPFPHISSLSVNLAVVVQDSQGKEHFARVKVPDTIRQLVPVKSPASPDGCSQPGEPQCFAWLEQLITANLQYLFPGLQIVEAHAFRATRDAEVAIQELESDDLLETVEEAVWQRRFRAAVRLQVSASMPDKILKIITSNIEIESNRDVYRAEIPLDIGRLRELYALDRPELKDKPFVPLTPIALQPKSNDIFAAIRRENILLHHPFESFQPVVEFLRKAAQDPDVLAIKMTLYRVGRNSPVVAALLEAVENGKQVAAVVELKARFDEESNIEWARSLESEGVHVVYGLVGLKVHAKVALVVRREGDHIRRYIHLGTGNYNPTTAHAYTDLGFFTCDEDIGADASDLFNYLTGYSAKHTFRKLLVAPLNLRGRLEELILREIGRQKNGEQGHLIFKMNALEDPAMIKLLYRASQAGVRVDLLVRGFCCLRPGLPGVSENIRVTSIVGRFLEHSRIYYFRNGGAEEIYLGSADMMPRNLSRRVEVVFPVEAPKLVRRLKDEILATYLADEVDAWYLQSDGSYTRAPRRDETGELSSQLKFLNQ